jgi:glycosidase
MLTKKINDARQMAGAPPEKSLRAGDLNAMGLIDEILHHVIGLYGARVDPSVFSRAESYVGEHVGDAGLQAAASRFGEIFPAGAAAEEPRSDAQERDLILARMLLVSHANANPAFSPFTELFDDADLSGTPYETMVGLLADFFRGQPAFGPDNQDLVTMLESPMRAAPDSLTGQLEYIRSRWGSLLGDLLLRLLTGIDIIREEEKMRFGGFPPPPPEVYEYAGQAGEVEAFSTDREWMPRAVMIAKNALVWLDQLSRSYGREIRRLDQVPDEELDRMSRAGFTALWLIGVWERSGASREIKRRMGNSDAEASAYSLFDYVVAGELGGQQSLDDLKARAWQRGIRMASDMVPNHTGVDSQWMARHPGRFLAWPHPWPPFPSYTFNGPNISQAPGIGVFLEDRYWNKTDAAVVFKRVDFASGDTRLLYHGNDGTHMPWNDTAQLDFLNPETREAVIQTILHVARSFPIIRFDAAMTLAKKHYQRLWFPEPGKGGDIPSRAGNGMSRHDFDKAMPVEFWREVVDRVAREAPDTLLLAEAFWLLEGFFVRTLGMHRVYNSAFMHMLKDEDNAGYRQTLRNTLEFDPEVLKRFVNFMSNPDEQTAIEQFGDGDKYFGVCTLLATLPGLPMFAHGQLEGFREKYGMEFRRAYWNESVRGDLVARHEREIFPLLRRRHIFSGVDDFLLYDFWSAAGGVNEDVFAFSNCRGNERGMVLYNNRYAEARGWVRTSVGYAVKTGDGKAIVQKQLAEGLSLPNDHSAFLVFREHRSGLQFMRSCRELWEKGMYAELGAFQCQVFLDLYVVQDDAQGRWSRLAHELAGRGVPSIDTALREQELRPLLDSFKTVLWMKHDAPDDDLLRAYAGFLAAAEPRAAGRIDTHAALREMEAGKPAPKPRPRKAEAAAAALPPASEQVEAFLHAWRILRPLRGSASSSSPLPSWIDEWMIGAPLGEFLKHAKWDGQASTAAPAIMELVLHAERQAADAAVATAAPRRMVTWAHLLSLPAAERVFGVNQFEGVRWLRKESLQIGLDCIRAALGADGIAVPESAPVLAAAEKCGYRWDELLHALLPAAG